MQIIRKAAGVGFWTLVSRIFGFLRDILVAFFLGAGAVNDAFIAAFRLPNLFRTIFGEGAFFTAFVPLFSKIHNNAGHAAAEKFASQIQSFLFIILLIFSLIMIYFMPEIISLTIAGYDNAPEVIALATNMGRITFPYIAFVSYMSLYGGMLNSIGKFFAFASAPIILNLVQIIAIIVAPHGEAAGYYLSYGALIAGFLEMLWVYVFVRKAGFRIAIAKPKFTPEVKKLLRKIAPGIFGSGLAQINVWLVSTVFASFVPAGISYLYYADRIYQLPLALIGTALGTVLLGSLSELMAKGKLNEVFRMQNQAIVYGLLFALPAVVGLFILSDAIVVLLFKRGQFDDVAVNGTASALRFFSLALPAFVLSKILNNSFFAAGDTKTPVKIAFLALIINAAVSWSYLSSLGHVAIALGSAIANWISVILMTLILLSSGKLKIFSSTLLYACKIIIACLLMFICIVFLPSFAISENLMTILRIIVGAFSYAIMGILLLKRSRHWH